MEDNNKNRRETNRKERMKQKKRKDARQTCSRRIHKDGFHTYHNLKNKEDKEKRWTTAHEGRTATTTITTKTTSEARKERQILERESLMFIRITVLCCRSSALHHHPHPHYPFLSRTFPIDLICKWNGSFTDISLQKTNAHLEDAQTKGTKKGRRERPIEIQGVREQKQENDRQ